MEVSGGFYYALCEKEILLFSSMFSTATRRVLPIPSLFHPLPILCPDLRTSDATKQAKSALHYHRWLLLLLLLPATAACSRLLPLPVRPGNCWNTIRIGNHYSNVPKSFNRLSDPAPDCLLIHSPRSRLSGTTLYAYYKA